MNNLFRNANAIILCGGKSSRIFLPKPFIEINGRTIIENIVEVLKGLFNKIIIVTNNIEKYIKLEVELIVKDKIPGKGPLGGIYTGLNYSDTFYNFILACDMPFIEPGAISYSVSYTH